MLLLCAARPCLQPDPLTPRTPSRLSRLTALGRRIFFDLHCWHASWGGAKDRRFFSLGYFIHPKHATNPDHARQACDCATMLHPNWVEEAEQADASQPSLVMRRGWVEALRSIGHDSFGEFLDSENGSMFRRPKPAL